MASRGALKALTLARKAWSRLYVDAEGSASLARQSLAVPRNDTEDLAKAWAILCLVNLGLRQARLNGADRDLELARRIFRRLGDRRGELLVEATSCRCWWRQGRYEESLDRVLALREEGLRVLRNEERGMLLNTIAGCYSFLNDSPKAFAYMFQAMREAKPGRGRGFDAVVFCNIAHELLELGDYHEALTYIDEGLERCESLVSSTTPSVLLHNRIVCLTELGETGSALSEVRRLLAMDYVAGTPVATYATMSRAALRAGASPLATLLLKKAHAAWSDNETGAYRLELSIAESAWLLARGNARAALEVLRDGQLVERGVSPRIRCLYFHQRSNVFEALGAPRRALADLKIWRELEANRALMASRARHQAASLKTEMLKLEQQRDYSDSRRRASEKARAETQTLNLQLERKVQEVESLREALRTELSRSEQRRHDLEHAKLGLEDANAAKSRFLAAASHDLRQPMHAIGLLVGALRDQYDDAVRERQLGLIERSVDSLEKLFAGILDVSLLDAGESAPSLEDVAVDRLLERLELHVGPIAERNGVVFERRVSGMIVHTDEGLLDRVLRNLLSNAVAFTTRGRVVVRCCKRRDHCVIQVWDSGPGIPRQYRKLIFEEFFQIRNQKRDRSKGTGLGLSIAQRAASALGHKVTVRSRPGSGSLFSIALPLSTVAPDIGEFTRRQVAASVATGLFVVLVEDEETIRLATSHLLERLGATCLSAGTLGEALDLLGSHLRIPDVIISDYRLGEDSDGLKAIEAIRAQQQENIPAVLLTGDLRASLAADAEMHGVRLAHKPMSTQKLAEVLSALLSKAPQE